jgi:hypothetical protein
MTDFKSLLVKNSPEAQDLALKLRKLIRSLLPKAKEIIFPGWGVADYAHPDKARGYISIGPQKKYVNLYFMDGVDLPDPAGLLEGSGKRMRHVKIKTGKDLTNKALKVLIKAAAKFPGASKAIR